jgi:hypothetical protein
MCKKRWLARLWSRVEVIGKGAWIPILLVASLGLTVSLYNLYLSIKADRPKLVSMEATLFENSNAKPPEIVVFNWNNMGKRSALRGTVTLFTVSDDGNRQEKLGQSEISPANSSTTLTPTFGYGSARISVNMQKFLGLFLACVEYYDEESNPYKQNFLIRLGTKEWYPPLPPSAEPNSSHTRLEVLPSSTHQVCGK